MIEQDKTFAHCQKAYHDWAGSSEIGYDAHDAAQKAFFAGWMACIQTIVDERKHLEIEVEKLHRKLKAYV
jgi:hypothetical protein